MPALGSLKFFLMLSLLNAPTLACFLVSMAKMGWCPDLASAQALESSAETSLETSGQEQAFQQKQRRKLAIGWTLVGLGTGLAVSVLNTARLPSSMTYAPPVPRECKPRYMAGPAVGVVVGPGAMVVGYGMVADGSFDLFDTNQKTRGNVDSLRAGPS